MAKFISPDKNINIKSIFSIFAFNSSFIPDMIESKDEYGNIEQTPITPDEYSDIKSVLNFISTAPQLISATENRGYYTSTAGRGGG